MQKKSIDNNIQVLDKQNDRYNTAAGHHDIPNGYSDNTTAADIPNGYSKPQAAASDHE